MGTSSFEICQCERCEEQSDRYVFPRWLGYIPGGAGEIRRCFTVVSSMEAMNRSIFIGGPK